MNIAFKVTVEAPGTEWKRWTHIESETPLFHLRDVERVDAVKTALEIAKERVREPVPNG
jgi:hypothetical protein